jgi:hypothetical protein
MKKLSFLFAALFVSALVITSCQSKPAEQSADSTVEETVAPAVDTTAAPAADTTAAPAE